MLIAAAAISYQCKIYAAGAVASYRGHRDIALAFLLRSGEGFLAPLGMTGEWCEMTRGRFGMIGGQFGMIEGQFGMAEE